MHGIRANRFLLFLIFLFFLSSNDLLCNLLRFDLLFPDADHRRVPFPNSDYNNNYEIILFLSSLRILLFDLLSSCDPPAIFLHFSCYLPSSFSDDILPERRLQQIYFFFSLKWKLHSVISLSSNFFSLIS